jgi:intracellular septation protein A
MTAPTATELTSGSTAAATCAIEAAALPTVAVPAEHPRLKAIIRRLALSLLIACVVPAILFNFFLFAVNVWTALVAALVWSYSALAWRMATRRRLSGLLILTVSVMTLRTAVALSSGNTILYFLQPIVTDALLSSLFFVSLASARPVVARLAADFYPMDTELALRPRVQQLFWRLTLMWALLCLAKAVMTLWLLESQSLETFVVFKSVSILSINAIAAAATVFAAVLVARKEGVLRPA